MYLRTSSGLFISIEDRIPSRNLTCKHDLPSTTTILFDCEACMVTSRNYAIETKLSLAGAGRAGFSYTCLKVNEVEGYHESLVRECRYYPRDTLSGFDDFCIASPYSYLRGSYRACLCITSTCNFNYAQCIEEVNPNIIQKSSLFTNTIVQLTKLVKCQPPGDDSKQEKSASLAPLCPNNDYTCKSYLLDNAVLCVISVDQTNRTTRQSWIPSIYSAYLIKYKTQYCKAFTSTPDSVHFSQCKLDDDVCMCTVDGCNKDLETCRKINQGISEKRYSILLILLFLLNTSI
ncbi:unnamed protein product [Rotaria magnacalcarata]|nr:unnamed protein product [Rotaria magnacalcarata]CAF3771388.1 unnamed protein product [Rotaria magnacalcarata]CAF4113218.1 unnamed protein product [Rotaria magnacalcarata]